MERSKSFAIYKANKNINGSALQVDFNKLKQSVFMECANQKSEDRFDWDNKITVKLSASDMGRILEVLEGCTSEVKLFHQPSKGEYKTAESVKNAVVNFSSSSMGFSVRVSQQTNEGLKAVNVNISKGEGILLRILLSKAIEQMYGW
ncbi:hypothetical protein KO465_01815 [Candidatus Micrarchaeota archaeon]|nr:hypothetical protein [Candidatus Micrarchaeota archaeon]